MSRKTKRTKNDRMARRSTNGTFGPNMTRRGLLGTGLLIGLGTLAQPSREALAWSSWWNASSPVLKNMGMGDCIHEDLVQISYARLIRNHANDIAKTGFLNPWAGTLQDDKRYATIDNDTVDIGKGKEFESETDLAARLFRENLAYLRIGSFWNDAAANTLFDFGYSCYNANSIPKFSGNDYYEGAWDVGQHLYETNEQNGPKGLDALVQFTMNDRNNFIHGMLSSTASHSKHLKQDEIKRFALQWLGVAYEYARTGEVQATKDVTQDQAEKIFKGFIDTYDQLNADVHDMCVSLKVSDNEASIQLPHRRLRLRALGMMCHTMEDLWCPAHTCRMYYEGGSIPQKSILAFSNYKLQNGNKQPMFGYHIPFDKYATSDAENSTNWREALTRGDKNYKGTERLENVLDDSMSCLGSAHTYFNTYGMNETIECITKLFEFMYNGTAWDDGVRAWVDTEVMPTYFTESGQSHICDAGRRSLHTPTYIIKPINAADRAYGKVGLKNNHKELIELAKSYNAWQQGAHKYFSGKYNTSRSKVVESGFEGDSIWSDAEGESRLVALTDKLYEGYSSLDTSKRTNLLDRMGCNRCHDMVCAIERIRGMLQEFNIDLRGDLRADGDATMQKLEEVRAFFYSGTKSATTAAAETEGVVFAEANDTEDETGFETSAMAIQDLYFCEDGSYLIAVRNLDSLDTSVMSVPKDTPGIEKLEEGATNLTITYSLEMEFDEDPDYSYVVTDIDYSDMREGTYNITGWVASVAEDRKSLVLDLNGYAEYPMVVREGMEDIPEVGAYICASYTIGATALEFIGYGELDEPGELIEVTYPVEMVAGSSVWLVTNEDQAEDGYRDYLCIEYDSADVFSMPVEGEYVTVKYHDEVYGDVTDVDEHALASEAFAYEDVEGEAAEADDEFDSVMDDPADGRVGYLSDGTYDELNYGNEVFHVANVFGQPDPYPEFEDTTPEPAGPAPEPSNAPKPASESSAPKSNAQPTKAATPHTADPLIGLEGVMSATAVAGAAAVAYSAYRGQSESEVSEEN